MKHILIILMLLILISSNVSASFNDVNDNHRYFYIKLDKNLHHNDYISVIGYEVQDFTGFVDLQNFKDDVILNYYESRIPINVKTDKIKYLKVFIKVERYSHFQMKTYEFVIDTKLKYCDNVDNPFIIYVKYVNNSLILTINDEEISF